MHAHTVCVCVYIYIYIYISRDELKRDVLLWTPTHGHAKAGRPAQTYIQQLCEDMGCCPEDLPRAMNDREEWRERVGDIRATSTTWWWWWYIHSLTHTKSYIYLYNFIFDYKCFAISFLVTKKKIFIKEIKRGVLIYALYYCKMYFNICRDVY